MLMLSWAGVVLAGLLNGSFAVPLKTARTWKFNHIWMVHSLLAMGVIPWVFAGMTVPRWNEVLEAVPLRAWLGLTGWGVLFGIGSLLYGAAVDLLGIALGFAIQLGLSIVLGSLLPLLWARAFGLGSRHEWSLLLGLGLMVAGVILCARAGGGKTESGGPSGRRFRLGLIVALAGGILAPSLNFGIQYGTALLGHTEEILAPKRFPVETYLAWAVFLTSAALLQAGYCFWRVIQENSMALLRQGMMTGDALQVLVMSSLWISSVFIYGRSAFGLGRFGNSFGWPIFIALIILTSNAWGLLLGEWREAAKTAWRRMILGSGALIVAAFVIGQSKLPAQEGPLVFHGRWTATAGASQTFRGTWTAQVLPDRPNAAEGSWTLLSETGEIRLQGTWSARKAPSRWQGTWTARTPPGQLLSGTWSADLSELSSKTLQQMLQWTAEKEIAGAWRSGRYQGNWWLRASPRSQ